MENKFSKSFSKILTASIFFALMTPQYSTAQDVNADELNNCVSSLPIKMSDKNMKKICNRLLESGLDINNDVVKNGFLSSVRAMDADYLALELNHEHSSSSIDKNFSYISSEGFDVLIKSRSYYLDALIQDLNQLLDESSLKVHPVPGIKVVDQYNIHTEHRTLNKDGKPMQIGGLSGLTYDPSTQKLYSVSDDKSLPVIAEINLGLSSDYQRTSYAQINLTEFKEETPVKKPGFWSWLSAGAKPVEGDNEEIVLVDKDHFLVSSEDSEYQIKLINRDGTMASALQLPEDFKQQWNQNKTSYECMKYVEDKPKGDDSKSDQPHTFLSKFNIFRSRPIDSLNNNEDPQSSDEFNVKAPPNSHMEPATCEYVNSIQSKGLVFNKGIEGMTLIPKTRKLLFANEGPLLQDKSKGNIVRIYLGDIDTMMSQPPVWFYPYELDNNHDDGIVAMQALDSQRVLVLERGLDQAKQEGLIRLYLVKLDQYNEKMVLNKKLLLKFEDLKPDLAPGFKKIDNFEGMAVSQKTATGILVHFISDNNFNPKQRTEILTLEISSELLK